MNSVKVATYNVHNLFMQRDISPDSKARPKSERSLTALAESIDRLDADVVTLQEVSSKETIEKDLLTRRGLAEKYPYVALTRGNDKRGIQLAVISKYPFTEVVTHTDAKFPLVDGSGTGRFSRDLLRVDVDLDPNKPGPELTVYNTHSKSRRPTESGPSADDIRISEAKAVRDIAEKEMSAFPSRLFVVTGDFNDGTENDSIQAILNPGEGRETWVDSLQHLEKKDRLTWPSNPYAGGKFEPEQFDHIILPESKKDQLAWSRPVRYTRSDTGNPDDEGYIKWVSSTASDHLPVVAQLKLKD